MTKQTTTYCCDSCGKDLSTEKCNLNITTTKHGSGISGSKLHVMIIHRNEQIGSENADLCQQCCIEILEDALGRVKNGERSSEGTELPKMGIWAT